MYPILFEFTWGDQHYAISAYRTLMLLAAIATLLVGVWLQRRKRIALFPGTMTLLATLAGLYVGARASYWLWQVLQGSPTPAAGLWLPGGFTSAIATLLFCCYCFGLDVRVVADRMIPALGIGGAILRVGCFLRGCCFGCPTTVPWGVVFPWGSPAQQAQALENIGALFWGAAPVHPTQLYELVACLVAAGIGVWGLRSQWTAGVTTLMAGAWFTGFRAFNTTLRAPDLLLAESLLVTLAISLVVCFLCLSGMWWIVRNKAGQS